MNIFLHGPQELGVITGLEVISGHSNIQLVPGLRSQLNTGDQREEERDGRKREK